MITRMQIFHVAEKARWDAAKLAGSYAQSTLGRSLEDAGFIHASREDQWEEVLERYYGDVTEPLVLLVIDTDKLSSPWREEEVDGTTYPHVFGPINPAAVVEERPLPRQASRPPSQSFARLFLTEIVVRMVAGVVVMGAVVAGYYATGAVFGDDRAALGLLIGLVVGLAVVIPALSMRNRRIAAEQKRSGGGQPSR